MPPDSSLPEVESYLHAQIPLSADMGVRVLRCDPGGVRLRAPLAPNINHRATVFGGSASALAILAAWSWLHFSLRAAGHAPRVVIQRNAMEYRAPIATEFEAECLALPLAPWTQFLKTYARHGKGRVQLAAELTCGGATVGAFSGEYVALRA